MGLLNFMLRSGDLKRNKFALILSAQQQKPTCTPATWTINQLDITTKTQNEPNKSTDNYIVKVVSASTVRNFDQSICIQLQNSILRRIFPFEALTSSQTRQSTVSTFVLLLHCMYFFSHAQRHTRGWIPLSPE